jgi:hypothetical protein
MLRSPGKKRWITRRRYVKASEIRQIGKESSRWDERATLGEDLGAKIDYGTTPVATALPLAETMDRIIAALEQVRITVHQTLQKVPARPGKPERGSQG